MSGHHNRIIELSKVAVTSSYSLEQLKKEARRIGMAAVGKSELTEALAMLPTLETVELETLLRICLTIREARAPAEMIGSLHFGAAGLLAQRSDSLSISLAICHYQKCQECSFELATAQGTERLLRQHLETAAALLPWKQIFRVDLAEPAKDQPELAKRLREYALAKEMAIPDNEIDAFEAGVLFFENANEREAIVLFSKASDMGYGAKADFFVGISCLAASNSQDSPDESLRQTWQTVMAGAFVKAARADPGSAAYQYFAGFSLAKLGDWRNALQFLANAVRRNPQGHKDEEVKVGSMSFTKARAADIYFWLGLALERCHDINLAAISIWTAADLAPTDYRKAWLQFRKVNNWDSIINGYSSEQEYAADHKRYLNRQLGLE